jgi:GDP-4-dehydro-6-deoxy-D-mannose reductase
MEEAALELKAKNLNVVIARPFNHSGPGQLGGFLIPDLYGKIMQGKKSGEAIVVGSLETKRDYTDVRDIVRAYTDLALAENLSHDTYNVCSGVSRSGKEVLDLLLEAMGTKNVEIKVSRSLIRPNDPQELHGSYERLNNQVGWHPSITFGQTIKDYVKGQNETN